MYRGRVHMDMDESKLKEVIIKMIEKTNNEKILRRIYMFITSILG
jgi:hypothetical protein